MVSAYVATTPGHLATPGYYLRLRGRRWTEVGWSWSEGGGPRGLLQSPRAESRTQA